MLIAIDFDGTCVSHEFPKVGKDIGSVPILKKLVKQGHKLILFTMRSDVTNPVSDIPLIETISGDYLSQAVDWFRKNKIELYGIQSNPNQKSWTSSPKCYAELYIDDAALGCPLVFDKTISKKPFVDWERVNYYLTFNKILK